MYVCMLCKHMYICAYWYMYVCVLVYVRVYVIIYGYVYVCCHIWKCMYVCML